MRLVPCPMPCCGVYTRECFLEDASEFGPLLTKACPACMETLIRERAEDEAVEDFDRKQVDYWRV